MKKAAAAFLLILAAMPGRAAGFKWRGVLEGFYGRPWTWKQRGDMVDWMSRHGDNLFVIAPKDDPALRKDWRAPLSSEYLGNLALLQKRAKARSVSLAWTLSPLGVKTDDARDLSAAVAKFHQVLGLGVRKLAIAFDDTEPNTRQVEFANRVLLALAPDFPDLEMTFIPAVYWGKAAPSKYLDYVAEKLDPRFLVAWTGPAIISETVTAEDGRRFRDYIRHKLVLGDNYPVQDRLIDAGPLYLGPLLGREAGLADSQEAFVSNASPLPEASKLPLSTAADFMRDPAHYDPEKSWRRAIAEFGGAGGAHWVELLAFECASSWISDPPPDWLRRGGVGAVLHTYAGDGKTQPLVARLKEFDQLPARLKTALSQNPGAYEELRPWAEKLAALARAVSPAQGKSVQPGNALEVNWRNPAAVADAALDRFLQGSSQDASWPELLAGFDDGPTQKQKALEALRDLGFLAGLFPPSEDHGWPGGLLPWLHILGMSAQRALAYAADPRKAPFVPDIIWRWRMRMAILPLITDRALLEQHFNSVESSWKTGSAPSPKMGWLGLWLWFEGWIKPSAFPVVLQRRLTKYRATGEPGDLPAMFEFLAGLPAKVRAAAGPRMAPEIDPWLSKLEQYGRLGTKSLELAKLARSGGRPSEEQQRDWERDRERLASSNGLELTVKLKYRLDAFARWRRFPEAQRPKAFKVEWPPNPGDLF